MAAEAKIRIRSQGIDAASKKLGTLQRNMGGTGVQATATRGRMERLGASLLSLRTAFAAAGVYGAGRFTVGLLKSANALRSSENGFRRLMAARGIGGADRALNRFSASLDHMADRATVAGLASRLMAVNSNLNADAVAKVLRYSRDWADTTGQELLPVIQSLSSALGGMELETIRRLGLEVDFQTTLKETAKRLGKTTEALTEQEKRAAKTSVMLDAIAAKHNEIGRTAVTAANRIDRLIARWENAKARLGKKLEPRATEALEGAEAVFDVVEGKPFAERPKGKGASGLMRWLWDTFAAYQEQAAVSGRDPGLGLAKQLVGGVAAIPLEGAGYLQKKILRADKIQVLGTGGG